MGHRKGSDLYLKAMARLIDEFDFKCVAVGRPNEAYLGQLRQETPNELWDRFEFKYSLNNDQMDAEYRSATLTVMPTRADTGPVAIKEAVVAGIPAVASQIGGVPEYLEQGQNGFICTPDNLDDLVGKIREACRHPLFSRGKVATATLEAKRAHLDPHRAAKLFAEAYQRAWSQQARTR